MTDRLEPLLTVNDLAALFGVSRWTVYAFVRKGDLTPIRVGDRLRFERHHVADYLERRRGLKR